MPALVSAPDRRWVGDPSQHVSARRVVFDDGPERGVRAVEVDVYGGVRTTVLLDRGMDLAQTWCRGVPLAWLSPTGAMHAGLVDGTWLRGFAGGLLTTCGLDNVGPQQRDGEDVHTMHGRASWIAARDVHTSVVDDDGEQWLQVSGELTDTAVYDRDLQLRRRWRFSLTRPVITLRDEVVNRGWRPEPMLLLYHVNLGYPLISPTAQLLLPPHTTKPRDEAARRAMPQHQCFTAPVADAVAEVFEHVLTGTPEWTSVGVINSGATDPVGVLLRWHPAQLPRLWHWRMLGEGMYLTALEPANCGVAGRLAEQSAGAVDIVAAGDARTFELEFHLATDAASLAHLMAAHETSHPGGQK